MENQKLLKKYKIKLSFFFALFVMFSLYIIESIFLWILFISSNLEIKTNLENKLNWIINVLKNKETYYLQIESEDKTLQKIIYKTLENSIIYKDWEKIIDFAWFEVNFLKKEWIFNYQDKKYLIKSLDINDEKYKIILFLNNPFNIDFFVKQLIFYWIILSPFFIMFYFIWYFFVGRNFRVIEQSINSLQDFTANVNHEMKTPLSEIISTLSLAKKIWNYEEACDISLNSAKKLNKIIESIIWMANLSDISYKKERIDLIKELENTINESSSLINEKNIKIKKDFKNSSYTLKINKEHFYICVKNILSNAIKYSNNWWEIEIFFNNWILEIKDYWIWIDKSNLKNVLNRYFRESYTNVEWFWLWLALVKKITDINKWKFEIESEKNLFTKITINFF